MYLLNSTRLAEYENGCTNCYSNLALIMPNLSINKMKNIFKSLFSHFFEDSEDYNNKLACVTFNKKYSGVINRLIKCINSYFGFIIIKFIIYIPNNSNIFGIMIV